MHPGVGGALKGNNLVMKILQGRLPQLPLRGVCTSSTSSLSSSLWIFGLGLLGVIDLPGRFASFSGVVSTHMGLS